MDPLLPNDKVKHIPSGLEGTFVRPILWRIGRNTGEGYIVRVGKDEQLWLYEETEFIERPSNPAS